MKWILYAILAASVAAGGILAASARQEKTGKQQEELEEFVPTEKVPADSSISFPVDI